MKSKKLKKIVKLFHEEIRNYDQEMRPTKVSEEISNGDWSEYDSEVSEKFKKMVLNLRRNGDFCAANHSKKKTFAPTL